MTVEAENPTDARVEYGLGSSTCQYLAVVRYAGEDRGMPVSRLCTPDEEIWYLDPGERRSETWTWSGEVVVDDAIEQLPAGKYELRGVAGVFTSSPATVAVVE